MDENELRTEIEEITARQQSSDLLDEDMPPAEPIKDKSDKKDDGIPGVFTFQTIIAVGIAIFYVLCLTFFRPETQLITQKLKEKLVSDFSFQQTVYTAVGSFFTYLNTMSPVDFTPPASSEDSSESSSGGEQEENEGTSSDTVSMPASSEQSSSDGSSSNELMGAGGTFEQNDGTTMPDNATFAPVIFTGSILYPVKSGAITSEFGFRINPLNNEPDFHNALDIAAPRDTPIRAAADGVVIKSEFDASLGNFIRLQHAGGFVTTYGHCDRLIAKPGAHIKEGEIVARVGSTGDSTGPHVHFATAVNGMYFDPNYLYDTKLGLAW